MKQCHGWCRLELPITEFSPSKQQKDGHAPYCRSCYALYAMRRRHGEIQPPPQEPYLERHLRRRAAEKAKEEAYLREKVEEEYSFRGLISHFQRQPAGRERVWKAV